MVYCTQGSLKNTLMKNDIIISELLNRLWKYYCQLLFTTMWEWTKDIIFFGRGTFYYYKNDIHLHPTVKHRIWVQIKWNLRKQFLSTNDFLIEIISGDKLRLIYLNICNSPLFSARLHKFENFCRLRKKEFPSPAGIRTGVSWVAGSYTSLYTMATDTIRRFI